MTRRLASFRLIQRLCAILALCNIQLISSSSSSSTVSANIISAKPQQHDKIFKPSKRTIVSGFGAHSTKHSIFATTQATTSSSSSSSSSTSKTSKKASKKEQSKSKPAKEEESIIGPKLDLGNKSLLVYKQDANGSNNDVDQPPTDSVIWLMDETNQKVCIWVNEHGNWMAEVVVEDTAAAANQGQISQPTPPTSSSELNGWTPVEGLYGFYKVPTGILLVLIVKTQNVFEAPPLRSLSDWWRIDKVQHLEVVHLSNAKAQRQLSPIQIKEEIRQLRLLRKAWKQHDFYCCQYDKCEEKSDEDSRASPIVRDMTKSLQSSFLAHQNKKSLNNKEWWTANPDPRFFWNQVAVEPILAKCVTEGMNLEENPSLMDPCTRFLLDHTIPVTSAFVGVQSNITCDDESSSKSYYTQLLISRRSRFRAGTRFTRRGADANGAVANYAETEQVLLLLRNDTGIDKIASHVQTRGSIPIRWSSPADVKTYRPKVHIGTDPLAQARALRWHLLEQQAHYVLLDESKKSKKTNNDAFEMVFVNLVDKKSDQGRLGKAFDEVLQAVLEVHNNSTDATKRGPLVKHVWYDFHAEVKNGKWDRLSNLLKDIEPNLNAHNYLVVSPKNEKRKKTNNKASTTEYQIESKQTSVVRTNCMDCLDRTNVVQSIFGRYILFDQLLTKEMDPKTTKTLQKQFQKSKQMSLPWPQSEISHRSLWADNADAISQLYAGTPALKRDFTRTGQRTKLGALDDGMNSLQRYYLNNFMDADRQEGMDLMVGYASFSNIGSTITSRLLLENDDEEDKEGESIFATRRSFLGGLFQPQQSSSVSNDNEKDAAKHDEDSEEEEDDDVKDALDLRWVPGDLQEHLRSRLEGGKGHGKAKDTKRGGLLPKLKFGFSSTRALKAMDERSISDLPWWYLEEENVEDNDAKVAKDDDATVDWLEKLGPHQRHPTLTPGMVLSVLVLGFRAPMAMAKGIFSLVGLLYLQDVLSLDWKIVQDVVVELEMRLAALKEQQDDKDSLSVTTSSHDSDEDDDEDEEEED